MAVFPLSLLPDLVHASVSGGYVVALALICALQYVAYVHRINRARREQQECARDRNLSRHENDVLQQFLCESNCEKALQALLARLAPDADRGFAACLRWRPTGWGVEHGVGLSLPTGASLDIDAELGGRLASRAPILLEDQELRHTPLWRGLPAADQAKAQRLYLFGIGGPDDFLGALVTTALLPHPDGPPPGPESTARIVAGLAGSLRDRWRLESRQNELRLKEAMLVLRKVADRQYDSPLQMIDEFIVQAAARVGSERAVLYLYTGDQPPQSRAIARCGQELPRFFEEQWRRDEDRLAVAGTVLRHPEQYSGGQLPCLEGAPQFGSALLVPVIQQRRTIGLVLFTRRPESEFSTVQRQLGAWSGTILADLIPRIVNQAVIARQAWVDALTQLANRGGFDRRIVQEANAARESGEPLSLLLFDLDRFKSINDRHGHRGGDAVLRAVAALVRDCVRDLCGGEGPGLPFVARYGGEELAVLLPHTSQEHALRIGEAICAKVGQSVVEFEGARIAITTSVGLGTAPDHARSVDELVGAADAALYQAKARGRNRLEVAEAALCAAG